MLGRRTVVAIAELARAAASRASPPQRAERVLEVLRDVTPFAAAELSVCSPFSGRHVTVANAGYPDAVLAHLNGAFVASDPGFPLVLRGRRPMTMRDVPFDYWATPSFRGVFGPAGFEEGLTACLFEGGRYTGMLNLSTTSRSHPTADERDLIAEVAPALARVTDVLADLEAVAAVLEAPEVAFAVTASGPPVALPGWPTGDLPERAPQLIGLARRVLASGRPRAAFLRHDPQRGWRSVDVVRVRERARAGDDGLTLRELEVLSLLAGGASNPEIARRLHTSPRTVGTHVEHILAKLGTPSRAGAAAIAQRDGLLLAGWPAEPG